MIHKGGILINNHLLIYSRIGVIAPAVRMMTEWIISSMPLRFLAMLSSVKVKWYSYLYCEMVCMMCMMFWCNAIWICYIMKNLRVTCAWNGFENKFVAFFALQKTTCNMIGIVPRLKQHASIIFIMWYFNNEIPRIYTKLVWHIPLISGHACWWKIFFSKVV